MGRSRDLHQRAVDVFARTNPARDPPGNRRSRARAHDPAGLRRRVRLRVSGPAPADARSARRCRTLSGRPDQRHFGIRRGGGAGYLGGHQRGARGPRRRSLRARPFGSVRGGPGRRPDDEGPRGAVPSLHLARGAPTAPGSGLGPAAPPAARAAPGSRVARRVLRGDAVRGAAAPRGVGSEGSGDPSRSRDPRRARQDDRHSARRADDTP